MTTQYTDNFGFELIDFNLRPWDSKEWTNWRLLDRIVATLLTVPNLKGTWRVSTAYSVGDAVLSSEDFTYYTCNVAHTSAAAGLFSADRAAHPSYWTQITQNVGALRYDSAQALTDPARLQAANNAGALAYVGTQSLTSAQKAQVLSNLDIANLTVGQCKLVFTSTTLLTLIPWNGNKLFISDRYYNIPAAGVTLANTGISAGSLYYVYAFISGGNIQLAADVTVPTVDTTTGVIVRTGDSTKTLVGVIYGDTGGVFADSSTKRYVISWFNNAPRSLLSANVSVSGITSLGTTQLSGTGVSFICLGGEVADLGLDGQCSNTTAGQFCTSRIGLDASPIGNGMSGTSATANAICAANSRASVNPSAGFHTSTGYGLVSGGSGSWSYMVTGKIG